MRYFLVIVWTMSVFWAFAQEEDTLYLNEVQVISPASYSRGMHVSEFDSSSLVRFSSTNLGDFLQENSGLYLRQYGGEGQTTTISFRGTTPSQTRVNWQGVDINSQTLGQSDFSSIPVYLFQGTDVYHGSSSVLFGSGAIGGTIDLKTKPIKEGLAVSLEQHVGSFGKWFSGIRTSYRNNKWSYYLSGVRSSIQNDFEVDYRGSKYRQNNASSIVYGVAGGGSITLSQSSKLSLNVWYNQHDRNVQPLIGDFTSHDHLLDKNFRSSLSFQQAFNASLFWVSIAYVDDQQSYNDGSHTNLKRYISSWNFEWLKLEKWQFLLDGKVSFALPDVSNFAGDTTQFRGSFSLLTTYDPFPRLNFSLNIRQPFLQGLTAPIVPALGVDFSLLANENTDLSILGQIGRSYRFPTFNDLFWQPGGNPDLKAEDGLSVELGLKPVLDLKSLYIKGQFSAYRSEVSEMIVWIPAGSFWMPENIKEVKISGLDFSLESKTNWNETIWTLKADYALNASINQTALSNTDQSKNKQLPYVPKHKGSFAAGVQYHGWGFTYNQSYVGIRYTESTNSTFLEGYSVASINLGKQFKWIDQEITVSVGVKNIWDKDYQNYELRATPGRNYSIQLKYQLTNNKL